MHSNAAVTTDREVTLNERLNKALNTLGYQCERLEAVLSRVNGTPQKIESASRGSTAPTPVLSMQNNVEGLEVQLDRLVNLSNGVERIA